MEWLMKAGGAVENITNYDCRGTERKAGYISYPIGAGFLMYGIIVETTYILTVSAMLRKQLRRLACYKIMIELAIYDMSSLAINSLLTGYFWMVGANYCTYPTLIFISGSINLGLWCGTCATCLLLVVNRLLDVWNKRYMLKFFGEKRIYIALLIPVIYSTYFAFFTPPVLFNSDRTAWFFATFADNHSNELYYNFAHTANNLLVVALTGLLYIPYGNVLLRHHNSTRAAVSWAQKSFFLQTSSICVANLIGALVYAYMQFFPTPPSFVTIGHISWQLGEGIPAFVYLFLNRTIQKEVLRMLGICRKTNMMSPYFTSQSKQQTSDIGSKTTHGR